MGRGTRPGTGFQSRSDLQPASARALQRSVSILRVRRRKPPAPPTSDSIRPARRDAAGSAFPGLRAELPPTIRLATPIVAAELGWIAMGLVDLAMVGRLGPAAIGAVGIGSVLCLAVVVSEGRYGDQNELERGAQTASITSRGAGRSLAAAHSQFTGTRGAAGGGDDAAGGLPLEPGRSARRPGRGPRERVRHRVHDAERPAQGVVEQRRRGAGRRYRHAAGSRHPGRASLRPRPPRRVPAVARAGGMARRAAGRAADARRRGGGREPRPLGPGPRGGTAHRAVLLDRPPQRAAAVAVHRVPPLPAGDRPRGAGDGGPHHRQRDQRRRQLAARLRTPGTAGAGRRRGSLGDLHIPRVPGVVSRRGDPASRSSLRRPVAAHAPGATPPAPSDRARLARGGTGDPGVRGVRGRHRPGRTPGGGHAGRPSDRAQRGQRDLHGAPGRRRGGRGPRGLLRGASRPGRRQAGGLGRPPSGPAS